MQRPIISIVEVTTNIGSGMVIAYALTLWVLPLWGFQPSVIAAAEITALYTVASFVRALLFRRVFNAFTRRGMKWAK